MMVLFPAHQEAFTTFRLLDEYEDRADGTRKRKAIVTTVRRSVTEQDWEDHLAGKRGIGLQLSREDGTTRLSIVDGDDYTIMAHEIVDRIGALARPLPLYVNRSKSGLKVAAVHDKDIPTAESLKVDEGIARLLKFNMEKVELFPQEPKDGNLAKSISMPYFGDQFWIIEPGSKTTGEMRIERFLANLKYLNDQDRAYLIEVARQPKEQERDDDVAGQGRDREKRYAAERYKNYHRELTTLPEGRRNDTLYSFGSHMGKMIGAGWIERETVESGFKDATKNWQNQSKTLDTLTRALNDGVKEPHGPCERCTRTWRGSIRITR
jgi:hypothetical protein